MYQQRATKDFLGKPAPVGYVAGLGRGATGFMTRPDLGPGRDGPAPLDPSALAERMAAANARKTDENEEDDDRFMDNENEEGLLASSGPVAADDEEADHIFAAIDAKMDERRKSRRERVEQEQIRKYRQARPKIQTMFADLKQDLTRVSDAEWDALPEGGDNRAKRMKKTNERERFTPLPDSVLLGSRLASGGEYTTKLDSRDQMHGGLDSGTQTSTADFKRIGEARERVLGVKLDQASSAGGTTTVDPLGYLTHLDSQVVRSDTEINDIKRARLLLKNVVTTNPKNHSAWISSARVEEVALNPKQARALINRACEECPTSEDVWLEAVRLNAPQEAVEILGRAIKNVPESPRLWLHAASLEKDKSARRRILRRALESIPNSVKLWKALVEMEESEEDARILLSRAVECIPSSVDLWLALARLEGHENARRVLNKARQACPTSHEIWINAARLEEAHGNDRLIETIVQRAVFDLSQKGVLLDREKWLKEAEDCEASGDIKTAQAIVNTTALLNLEDEDRRPTWLDEAESSLARGAVQTARAILSQALQVFPDDEELWGKAVNVERKHDKANLFELLQKAVEACPRAETLWLVYAQERLQTGDIGGARKVLSDAFTANANSENVWLAASTLESDVGEFERARLIMGRACEKANTARVWMKSALLERRLKHLEKAKELLVEAVQRFPKFDKLWMMLGQLESSLGNATDARDVFERALKSCPQSASLWILAAEHEETSGILIKARAILEKARLALFKNPNIWLKTVKLELKNGQTAMAKTLMAKALQECPDSGILWAEAIFMEARPLRKSKSMEALRRCGHDAYVYLAVGRLFWADRQLDQARDYLERATRQDPDLGDTWAHYLLFFRQHGDASEEERLLEGAEKADPRHGLAWPAINKADENWRVPFRERFLKLVDSLQPPT